MVLRHALRSAIAVLAVSVTAAAGGVAVTASSAGAVSLTSALPGRVSSTAFQPKGSGAGSETSHPATTTSVVVRSGAPATTSLLNVKAQGAASPMVLSQAVSNATPSAPFTECPAIGAAASCDVLVQITDGGNKILDDPSQGPYDGSDDTLIGVVNNSSATVSSLALSANTNLFGFDGDGLCVYSPIQPGCPFGSTGYEGPGTSFSGVNQSATGGVVSFAAGLAPGATAYFSLEQRLAASAVVAGGPSAAEQGHAPNASQHSTTCHVGQPVNCATGDFWHQFTDFTVPGRGVPLIFQRTFDASAAATDGSLGFGWTDSYAMSLAVDATGAATITQENGAQVVFQPNGAGGFTAAPRVLATLVSNPDGTFTFTRKPNQIRYVFSNAGQLISESDRNNAVTSLAYTGSHLTTVTDPSGRTLTLAYAGSHISAVTDPLGRTDSYGYDAAGNLVSTIDAAGQTWKFTYDPNHLLLSMTDPAGGVTTNVYDTSNRVTTQTDVRGLATTWSYAGDAVSPGGGTTTMTEPNGIVTTYDYANLELQDVTHASGTPLAATTRYAYDPATLGVTSVTDPNGNITLSTYDNDGNQTSTTDPLTRTTSFSYDGLDDLTSKTTPAGQTTSYSYNGSGNLSTVTDPTGHATGFTYGDPAHPGDVTQITDRDGRITTLTYDAHGGIGSSSVSPSAGLTDTTTNVYDADGERTCQASPKATAAHVTCPTPGSPAVANTTTNTYDQAGRLTATTDPNGHTTTYGYDQNSNRTKLTDANGQATTYGYDADNELTAVTRADGTSTSYAYDSNGNRTSQSDGAGKATQYAYDALSRQIAVTDPLGRITKTAYDLAGNRTSTIDPAARTTTYAYDAANQLTGTSYSDAATHAVSDTYTADGKRSAMTDGTGTTTYAYDTLDRLTGQTNGAGSTVLYTYNNTGQEIALTYPNGQVVTTTYDGAGQSASITDWLGKAFTFGYDANSNLTTQADPNGVTATTSYDNADQLTAITDKTSTSTLASFTYTRDNLGQLTSTTPTGVPGGPESYSYTKLNQLASLNSQPYSYDQADNLIKLADGTTQTFDAANQLTTSTPPPTASSSKLAVDQVVSADQKKPASKITSPNVKTSSANELVLAFVSTNGQQQISKVSGAGLTWTLASRPKGAVGTAEVWQAYATTKIHDAVTATLAVPKQEWQCEGPHGWEGFDRDRNGERCVSRAESKDSDGSITVATFTGAAKKVGATSQASGRTGAPAVTLTTTAAASLIWAAGLDAQHPASVTPVTGQTLVHQFRDTRMQDTSWVQHTQAVAVKGTTVKIADTSPSKDTWELAAVEIVPAAASAVSGAGTPTAYTYDSQGNRTGMAPAGGTTTTLAYDQANRLIAYGAGAAYAYDGDGLRMKKTVSGTSTAFAWDQSGGLPLLLADGSDSYIYGPDGQPLEKISGTTPTYLHHDQNGSTRLLTDATGAIVGTYTYDPYGKTTAHSGSASASLQYNGQYTDAESGYVYLRARYYDPATGQFLSKDPLVALTQSAYGYASLDPLNEVDPGGLAWWTTNTWENIATGLGYVGLALGVAAVFTASAPIVGAGIVVGGVAAGIGLGVAAAGCFEVGWGSTDCGQRINNANINTLYSASLSYLTFGGNVPKTVIGKELGIVSNEVQYASSQIVSMAFPISC